MAFVIGLILAWGASWAKPVRPDLDSPAAAGVLAELKADPNLACRFPVAYENFRTCGRLTGPPLETACPSFDVVTERGERLTLAPKRLFEVQYLVAGRGGGFASRFGHAMLRLVFCAPDRDVPSAACRADSFYAVDVGFAAHTDTQTFSVVGGVTGRYPSWLTITADPDLRLRYVDQELRGLTAWPLKLPDDARRALLALIIERHWSYDGRYKFLSNNCADEILKALQLSLAGTHPLVTTNPNVFTPQGLLELLTRMDLIGDGVFTWESRRPRLDQAVKHMSLDPYAGSARAYLDTPAATRRGWILAHGPRNVAAYTALEDVARREARARLTRTSIDVLYKLDRATPKCAATRAELKLALETASADVAPARLRRGISRGVPTAGDIEPEALIAGRQAAIGRALSQITACFAGEASVARATEDLNDALEIERRLHAYLFSPSGAR